jgi:hypothetical protein
MAVDDLALVTNLLNRSTNLHFDSLSIKGGGFRVQGLTGKIEPCPRCHLTHTIHSTLVQPSEPSTRLLVAVHNPSARQVVRTQLNGYAIAGQNADEVLPHTAGNVRQHLVLIFQLHFKHRVRQGLDDRCHHFNRVFLRHPYPDSAPDAPHPNAVLLNVFRSLAAVYG